MNKIIVLSGPTGVGKSACGIELAQRLDAAIISADSMQIYKYMDIGTAKITTDEMRGIRHYMLDIVEPDEEYNVKLFQSDAKKIIRELFSAGKTPIIVGGTGLYINSLIYALNFRDSSSSTTLREKYTRDYEAFGKDYVYKKLCEIDPASAAKYHPNESRRIIRALESFELTGVLPSKAEKGLRIPHGEFEYTYFALMEERNDLYKKIDARVERMLQTGLVDEVRWLLDKGYTEEMQSMKAIGYKETIAYLKGNCTYDEYVFLLKRNTKRYAKRQITWLRSSKEIIWLDKSNYSDRKHLVDEIEKRCI